MSWLKLQVTEVFPPTGQGPTPHVIAVSGLAAATAVIIQTKTSLIVDAMAMAVSRLYRKNKYRVSARTYTGV